MPTPPDDVQSSVPDNHDAEVMGQPASPNSSEQAPSEIPTVHSANVHPKATVYVPAPPPRWQRWLRATLWAGTFVGTAAVMAVSGAMLGLWMPLPTQAERPSARTGLSDLWQTGFRYQVTRPVNVLVMGIDEVPGAAKNSEAIFSGRTDTLLLVRIDPESNAVNVLSIPRDTRLHIPGYGVDKVNQANVEGGPELVAATISANFGDIPIDRYLRVSTGAFEQIVDLVGGVEVLVPKRMAYTDHSQDLYIDLYPGLQTLNGNQAEQFARFRQDVHGDIGRVQRQQMLLKALRERIAHPTVIPKLPQLVRILQRYIDTNLSFEEMLALANFGLNLQTDDLHMVMLPGRFSEAQEYVASYWLPDRDASLTIFEDYFQADPVVTFADNREPDSIWGLRIAVQNAASSPRVATKAARQLREQGFYNVYVVQDWPAAQARTEIVAQRGNLDSARTLKSLLGTGRAVAESTGDLQSDITLRVGDDWPDIARDNSAQEDQAE